MAEEKNGDLIEAMISSRPTRRATQNSTSEAETESEVRIVTPGEEPARAPRPSKASELEGRIDVRPIGTPLGFRELSALHKRTWGNLNVHEKRVHVLLWPLALHFGLYDIRAGQERKRPPLIGAFWGRCLADSPLTLGHLYPASLFKGLDAIEVWEFGGLVIDPNYQGKGLLRTISETAKLFLFSRRPKLIITSPVETLYPIYKQFGLKTVGKAPIQYPYVNDVKVWLMYGDFEELAKPYFM
ncbi:MAG TPA: hypothetical protein VEC38_12375 [Candidatus Binataceae bacterium]|nr:hypothetical protein [Candidatus Binataceae bacterium]